MNAQLKIQPVDNSAMGHVVPEGYLVSNEALEILGDGDVKSGRATLRLMIADEREIGPKKGPTMRPTSVRTAEPEDEAAVVALLIEDISRTQRKWAAIAPDKILQHVQFGTRREGGIVGVIEEDDRIVACTVLAPAQPAWSKIYYLQEIFNVVHRDYRRSRHGQDLIEFGNWCADDMTRGFGYPVHLVVHVNTLHNVRKKLRFYRRWMTQIGATFIYPTID